MIKDEIRQILEEKAKQIEDAVADAILEEALEIVPVDSGELAESGKVEGGSVIFDAPHAMIVHETHSTGYKFLYRASKSIDIQEIIRDLE